MDMEEMPPILASIPDQTPPGIVLGNPGLERLLLEISSAKQYVFKMPRPPIMYLPAMITVA